MNIRKFIGTILVIGFLATPATALAFTDSTAGGIGFNIDKFAGEFQGVKDPKDAGLVDTVINIVNALLVLAAIAAIVFIILGGVKYVTSQGDEDAVETAKNTIIYGIVGIIVILLAAVIVNFFVAQVSGGGGGTGLPPPR